MFKSNCWLEVNLQTLLDNKHNLEKHLHEGCKVCCVVKANAYGHGAVEVAHTFEKDGVDYFAVANIIEALELRDAGIRTPILILGHTNPECANLLVENYLTQTVYSKE